MKTIYIISRLILDKTCDDIGQEIILVTESERLADLTFKKIVLKTIADDNYFAIDEKKDDLLYNIQDYELVLLDDEETMIKLVLEGLYLDELCLEG